MPLIERYKGTNKSLTFDEETLELLLDTQYGSAFAYMVLSIIYPLNHNYKFHQDHIHPKKYFNPSKLIKMGVEDEQLREQYLSSFNTISNLQLIQETENLEKNAIPFKDWVYSNYKDEELINYKNLHFIPLDSDLSMINFLDFYKSRRAILKSKLSQVLNVTKGENTVIEKSQIIEEELN